MERNSRNQEVLPADIVHEILFCLSVKHLTKFKCVCKSWASIISDPLFQQDHFTRCSNKDPLLLIKTVANRSVTLYHSALINNGGLSLVNNLSQSTPKRKSFLDVRKYPLQSCRGLVCLYSLKNDIFLCNPSTEEMITLPPTKSTNTCIGFGYASSTKEFKVVRFFEQIRDKKTHCEVFTLGTDSWREARRPPFRVSWSYAPFVHESIYLKPEGREKRGGYITAFDIECEECNGRIQFPEYYYSIKDSFEVEAIELMELQGSLCLTFGIGTNRRSVASLPIWLLKDKNNGKWVQGYNIDLSSSVKLLLSFVPVVIFGDGTILIDVYTEEDEVLLLYDPKRKIVIQRFCNICSAVPYVQSFFQVCL